MSSCKLDRKAGPVHDVLSAVAAFEFYKIHFDSLPMGLTCDLRPRIVLSFVGVIKGFLHYFLFLHGVALSAWETSMRQAVAARHKNDV